MSPRSRRMDASLRLDAGLVWLLLLFSVAVATPSRRSGGTLDGQVCSGSSCPIFPRAVTTASPASTGGKKRRILSAGGFLSGLPLLRSSERDLRSRVQSTTPDDGTCDKGNGAVPATRLGRVSRSFESVTSRRGGASGSGDEEDIDAAELLAACRSFLSILRETGPRAVADDFESNLRKVEASRDRHGSAALSGRSHTAPLRTVSCLLRAEIDAGLHEPGEVAAAAPAPRLRDPSGAVGLLWMRRSIAFQADMYESLLPEANPGAEPTEAALGAYHSQLREYHGWALRQFYVAFLSTKMPKRRDMLAKLGGFDVGGFGDAEEEATTDDMRRLISVWKPLILRWKQSFESLGLEERRRV